MHHLEWFDYLRFGNCFLALISLYLIAKRARRDWSNYTDRLKGFSWAMQAFLFITIVGSLEQVAQDVPWGWRTLLTFIVCCGVFRSALRSEPLLKEGQRG